MLGFNFVNLGIVPNPSCIFLTQKKNQIKKNQMYNETLKWHIQRGTQVECQNKCLFEIY